METDKKLSALFSIVLCARLSLRPARMFDDCLHDNSLLAELKEQSGALISLFRDLAASGSGGVVVRNYSDVCKDL